MENPLVIGILNIVEDKLREFGIQIPDDHREDSKDPIVGYQYAELHDLIQEYLEESGIFKSITPGRLDFNENTQPMNSQHKRRLDDLHGYAENESFIKRAAEKEKQKKIDNLISDIKALEPRIRNLIDTGNACLQSSIPLTVQGFGMREDYDTNQFFTNSWSHLVGFVGNPHDKSCHIEFIGIDGGGACGVYNFRTDGVSVFSVNERNFSDIIVPSVGHMERFLKRFDEFESAFYNYVDKVIANQKQCLDKVIASAQEKQSKQVFSQKKDIHELDHEDF